VKADAQTTAESEEWAVEEFRRMAHMLEPSRPERDHFEWSKRLLRQFGEKALDGELYSWSGSDEEISRGIKAAREGRGTSHTFLLELAASRLQRGQALGEPLTGYIVEFLRNPKPPERLRGRKDSDYVERDLAIANVVFGIKRKWGFFATRNEATDAPSAISITQKALKQVGIPLTESAITRIVNRIVRWK
jgi:hypothetical protein